LIGLLLGAIINVAVAWGCIVKPRLPFDRFDPANTFELPHPLRNRLSILRTQPLPIGAFDRLTNLGWKASGPFPVEGFRESAGHLRLPWQVAQEPRARISCCLMAAHRSTCGAMERMVWEELSEGCFNSMREALFEVSAGWPFRSMCGVKWNSADGYTGDNAILTNWVYEGLIPIEYDRTQWTEAALPLRPVWWAFAVNSAFWGALVWLCWCGPAALRRRRRRKKHECGGCGYDLRGHGRGFVRCPECGRDAVNTAPLFGCKSSRFIWSSLNVRQRRTKYSLIENAIRRDLAKTRTIDPD
jgi:hypothetical protein